MTRRSLTTGVDVEEWRFRLHPKGISIWLRRPSTAKDISPLELNSTHVWVRTHCTMALLRPTFRALGIAVERIQSSCPLYLNEQQDRPVIRMGHRKSGLYCQFSIRCYG